ncbi:aldehyde dehydrogenase, partial [Lichtheimia hyalospora FSU 10163]
MSFRFLKGLGPHINSQWHTSSATRSLINPRTRQPLVTVHDATREHILQAIQGARSAQSSWQQTSGSERRDALLGIANAVEQHADEMTELEMVQTGKEREDAAGEVGDTIECLRFFAGHADKSYGQTLTMNGLHMMTKREPCGIVGLITSFNYPLMLAAWKLAPALAAGNCAILKPAPQTPLTSLALSQLAAPYLPSGVLSVIPGGTDVGRILLSDGHLDKASFTGSTPAGQAIMRDLSNQLCPVILECGGKNAAIVLPDADIDKAASHIALGAFSNAGQNCCAVSRVLVHRSIHDHFLDALKRESQHVQLGPLIDQQQFDRVRRAIDTSDLSPWWKRNDDDLNAGYYVPPTIFTQVPDNAPLATEEIFGPVLTVLEPYDDITSAIQRANDSPYGLAAGVFGHDLVVANRVVSALRVGYVWINTYNYMPPYAPFGGRKLSGIGKDLGQAALDEFTFTKSIVVGIE